mmetsp:Transcript_5572/g.12649  ORF Transcript_5572/g.12649 Transcript_5572/m.12649 type:complete len:269 (-) Transcript_5572:80-886(-)
MEEGEAGCHDSNAHAGHQMWLQHSGVQVGGGIDLARHLPDVHLEALLDLFQHSRILVVGHKGDCQTFCAESASTPDPVQVGVAVVRHVVVDDDVDPLNVNPASEQVCGDHDTFLELLELLISHNAVLLIQARVDRNGREIALHQELVQSNRPLHGLHEYDHLVEFQGIKQIVQLTVLLLLRELCVVLQQPVQGELRLLVHPDLMGVLSVSLMILLRLHGCPLLQYTHAVHADARTQVRMQQERMNTGRNAGPHMRSLINLSSILGLIV